MKMYDYAPMREVKRFQKVKEKQPKVDVVYDYKHQGNDEMLIPGTVWLRVYYTRTQRKYISTGVRVLPSQWSDRFWVIGRADSNRLNDMIKQQIDKALNTIGAALSVRRYMPSTKAMKVDRNSGSFLDFIEKQIRLSTDMKEDTKRHHMAMLYMLMEWGKMRRFEQVTKPNILAFVRWISTREIHKPGIDGRLHKVRIKQSTIYDHYKRLRKYIRLAQAEQYVPTHVLLGIKIDRGEEPDRERLTDDEMQAWLTTKQLVPYLEMVRLRFIVQMGTGLAYRDLMTKDFTKCEVINGQTILVDKRVKTKESFFCVILPFAVEILRKWDWKIPPISNVDYNKFLDRVAINCGIDKHITSHVARHTYACYCLRHGVRIEAVKRALGHKKLETTQIYARLADMDVLEAFKKTDIL